MKRVLDARRDTVDFRDRMYVPTLVEVPSEQPLAVYREHKLPVLDQGDEGACTGFGLAAVANFLLKTRAVVPDPKPVSAHMFYNLARRYDEWPGANYSGSSNRGAVKGWHKHGVCSEAVWKPTRKLVRPVFEDAVSRPLGAYFRVNHKDLVALHTAISEVKVLYASADVHTGWDKVKKDGIIRRTPKDYVDGGHAFAIVGYDSDGFWIQNSWGKGWGLAGFCRISYDDWLENGSDVWAVRLAAPIHLEDAKASASAMSGGRSGTGSSFTNLRPHIISLGNDGRLRDSGPFGSDEAGVRDLFARDIDAVAKEHGWGAKRRILLYAHGGLVPEDSAIQKVADYVPSLLEAGVYPIAFIWKTDFWTTLRNILQDGLRGRRPEGVLDAAKDFLFDRMDDMLEPVARHLGGQSVWSEIKENAVLATIGAQGGADFAAQRLAEYVKMHPGTEIHVAGHSAGSILMAPLLLRLTSGIPATLDLEGRHAANDLPGLGCSIASASLWAPACTTELFKRTYQRAVTAGAIKKMALFTMTDDAEQDDNCAAIYHKSLLYLVSRACEARPRVPGMVDAKGKAMKGEPLLGMANWIQADAGLNKFFGPSGPGEWIKSPNQEPLGSRNASRSRSHGGFDDDPATVRALLARLTGQQATKVAFTAHRSSAGARDRRRGLEQASAQR